MLGLRRLAAAAWRRMIAPVPECSHPFGRRGIQWKGRCEEWNAPTIRCGRRPSRCVCALGSKPFQEVVEGVSSRLIICRQLSTYVHLTHVGYVKNISGDMGSHGSDAEQGRNKIECLSLIVVVDYQLQASMMRTAYSRSNWHCSIYLPHSFAAYCY